MDVDPLTEAGKAIYGKFARIIDPARLDYRWSRLTENIQAQYIAEARAAIETFYQLQGHRT